MQEKNAKRPGTGGPSTGEAASDGLLDLMRSPPAKHRPLPFWSWNARLDKPRMAWQIGQMKTRAGGYFMHARSGIETEYLGEEWLGWIATGIEEGKQQGLQAWIYDEEGWPSGFAGGIVTALDPDFHGRRLRLSDWQPEMVEENGGELVGLYTLSAGTCHHLDVSQARVACRMGGQVMAVWRFVNPYYIDVMNAKAVKAFIDSTHELYWRRFGADFGQGMAGFFTDEPRLIWDNEGDIPWSLQLPGLFRADFGYELLDRLPLLFQDLPGSTALRHDYWKTVNRLFTTSYMEQIFRWCDEHHCELTGHVMMEESVFAQMIGTGGAMPSYEFLHRPGIDWLRRTIASPIVPKQVSSVAEQLGKAAVLTETYGLCGWNVSFEELKWIADWQYLNGVNLMCQHLEAYSLRGFRKRDYPPSLFYQQPWWEEYPRFTDYLTRLGTLLASGLTAAGTLVLHPMHSGWLRFDGSNNPAIQRLDADFIRTVETVAGLHFEYHLGDETILARHASVDGGCLRVGSASYRAVVLPSVDGLDSASFALLEQFVAGGGTVLATGDLPTLLDGRPDSRVTAFAAGLPFCGDAPTLERALAEAGLPRVVLPVSDIHCRIVDRPDGRLYFLANHSRSASHAVEIRLEGTGELSRVVVEEAGLRDQPSRMRGNETLVDLSFAPMQSVLLFQSAAARRTEASAVLTGSAAGGLPGGIAGAPALAARGAPVPTLTVRPGAGWDIVQCDDNALTLDQCSWSLDDGPWQEPTAVIHLMDRLLKLQRECQIRMRFDLRIEGIDPAAAGISLVAESPADCAWTVNGRPVTWQDDGWWRDEDFRRMKLGELLVPGDNRIELSRRFWQRPKVYEVLFGEGVFETEKNKLTYDTELESLYLTGRFGVRSSAAYTELPRRAMHTAGPFVIGALPGRISGGDLTPQGFCFFSGTVKLAQDLEFPACPGARIWLDLGHPDAALCRVGLNGTDLGALCWAPFGLDITDHVRAGTNRLELTLYSGNRNLLGPHHHINGEIYNVGPESFSGKWSWVERETEAQPIRPADRVKNYWKDGWCLVRFGPGATGRED